MPKTPSKPDRSKNNELPSDPDAQMSRELPEKPRAQARRACHCNPKRYCQAPCYGRPKRGEHRALGFRNAVVDRSRGDRRGGEVHGGGARGLGGRIRGGNAGRRGRAGRRAEQAAAAGLRDPEEVRREALAHDPFLHGGTVHMVGSGMITVGSCSIENGAYLDLSGRGMLELGEPILDITGVCSPGKSRRSLWERGRG